jgi:putative oxidoreductase
VTYIEFIGGICLILGVLTRAVAGLIACVIAVALVKVHLANGFFAPAGFEYTLLILSACATLFISGGGKFSLWKKP